jgi:hypothetical protein
LEARALEKLALQVNAFLLNPCWWVMRRTVRSSRTTSSRSQHMRTEDMNEGVQILLARMKTHPEEFIK